MTITLLITVLSILFIHWVADFLFQTEKMAINKSKSNKWLAYHVFTYTIVTFFGWAVFFNHDISGIHYFIEQHGLLVFGVTFITHFITDYITSRITTKLYNEKKYRSFFNTIGFDQLIHFITLFSTYTFIN